MFFVVSRARKNTHLHVFLSLTFPGDPSLFLDILGDF